MNRRRPFLVVGGAVAVVAVLWVAADRVRAPEGPLRRPIDADSIVMLGDSITAGGDWEALLPDRPMVNQGYSGFTTAELLPIATDVAAASPAAVYVLTGTNDVRDGLPPARTRDDLAAILDVFATDSPETVVVVQTVLPRRATAAEIVATNDAIVELAVARGLAVLDLHPEFDDGGGGLRAEETSDGWHLSDAGYDRWAALLAAHLADT